MGTKAELLEELAEVVLELRPFLEKDNSTGDFLHGDIDVRAEPEVLEGIIDDLRYYIRLQTANASPK